jgi:hypothetical protein
MATSDGLDDDTHSAHAKARRAIASDVIVMPVTSMRLVTLALLVACTRAEPTKDPIKPPDPIPVVPVVRPESRTLVLQRHRYQDKEAAHLAVTLGKTATDKLAFTDLKASPAQPLQTPGYYRALAATDGRRWALQHDKTTVYVASIDGGSRTVIELAFEPHGLHIAGDALYVGSDKAVCWIDLARAKAPCVELVNRSGYAFKAYDRFVRLGDRLLAIDDMVMPMFADWFSIDAGGRPVKRLGDWKLPDVINGHYDHAALLATGNNEYTVFLVAPYGIMSGDGHNLAAVPIRGDKLVFDPDLTLQNADGKTPILEEHDDRGGNKPPTVLAGTAITPWHGIAVTPDGTQVLIAAGMRGLLAVPADFTPATKTATAHLAGTTEVLDVRTQAGLVLVLVERQLPTGNPASVAELVVVDPKSLAPVERHVLPRRYDRFLD